MAGVAARAKRHHLVEMLEEMNRASRPQKRDSEAAPGASPTTDGDSMDRDRFRAVLESSGLGAWERDLATGRPLWARQVNDIFGIDFDDLDAGYNRLIEQIHPQDRPGFEAECDPSRTPGDRVTTEFRLVSTDGERWIASRGEVVTGRNGGLRLFAVLSDITHEKVSDQALQTTLERSRASFAGAPFGTAYVSLDGRVRSANAALCSLTGYDEGGLRNRAISEFTLSNRWSEVVAGLVEAEATDEPSNAVFEGPLERSDGSRLIALFGVTLLRDQDGMPASLMLQVQDITKQREAEEALSGSEERLRLAMDAGDVGVWERNLESETVHLSERAATLLGLGAGEFDGAYQDVLERVHPDDREQLRRATESLNHRAEFNVEYRVLHEDGEVWIASRGRFFIQPDGSRRLLGVVVDITQQKIDEEAMRYQALHDPLTGLFNRRVLIESLPRAIAAARRGRAGALFFIDLDHFKAVNDTAGHGAGDRLLVEVGNLLTKGLREEDMVIRLGGDEFAVLVDRVSPHDALTIGEKLRSDLDEFRFIAGENELSIGGSIGIALIDGSTAAPQVMAQADLACYAAKAAGRNRIELFHETAGIGEEAGTALRALG